MASSEGHLLSVQPARKLNLSWVPKGMDSSSASRVEIKVPEYVELPCEEYHVTEVFRSPFWTKVEMSMLELLLTVPYSMPFLQPERCGGFGHLLKTCNETVAYPDAPPPAPTKPKRIRKKKEKIIVLSNDQAATMLTSTCQVEKEMECAQVGNPAKDGQEKEMECAQVASSAKID